ncbi:YhgE/Pip domain-containing protein [Nocardia nova]|uniref:YhgE/Pip domain-containing protein n=1 Tax=Nocardia nova TaxID=37330 RepID=UPI00046D1EA9|nr:membrane protein [Nocardia nova]
MVRRRFRWTVLTAVTLVVAGAVAGGVMIATHHDDAPEDIAIVNADTGPAGARIVKALQADGSGRWTVAEAGASTGDHAAVITLPADLSSSLATLTSTQPHRAQLTVSTDPHADTAAVDDAVTEVTKRISAAGVDQTLAAIASARGSMQQAAFTSQLLNAGVRTASDAAGQFTGGAQQMLGFLDSAKSGAGALTAQLGAVHTALGQATTQANSLAGAFDATGLTIGQIGGSATALSSGLDQTLPVLRALPFAADPRLAEVIGKLDALRGIAGQADAQLSGLTQLTGSSSDPNTGIGAILRDAAGRLTTASTQLDQGAALAGQIPQLADQATTQLQGALQTVSGGITQMGQISANLTDQTGKALTALPANGASQQSVLATNLSDPVDVVRN